MLRHALRLARKGRYEVSPNPMVGAVVVRDGEVVGEGYHARVGGPHAEVMALSAAGYEARGATLYVTLEPCCAYGRTPPCTDLVVASGIRRVVACHVDPDPRVRGRGFELLAAAGIEIERGVLADEALRLNLRYLVPLVLERPMISVKWAMSLDGKVATAAGESQWISSPRSRQWALDQRELHDAILVGSGTVLSDDPRLNRRRGRASGPITRVILDRRLRTPEKARLFTEQGPVLLYTESADGETSRRLTARGAEVVRLPEITPATVARDLFERGVRSALVEGGPTVAEAFVRRRLFDQVLIACAPKLIGGVTAPGALGGEGVAPLRAAPEVEALRVRRRGPDLVLEALREGCLRELSQRLEP